MSSIGVEAVLAWAGVADRACIVSGDFFSGVTAGGDVIV